MVIAAFRLLLATLMILPFALVKSRAEILQLPKKDLMILILVGGMLAGHFFLWITSLKVPGVTVTSSVVLVTSHPIFVAPVSHFILKEKVDTTTAIGIAVGFSGVVVIGLGDFSISLTALGGDFLALTGGVLVAGYLLAGRRFRQRISVFTYALVVYASASAFLVLAATYADGMRPVGDLGRELVLFVLLALVSQIGGHTLYNWSLKYVTATVVSVTFVGEPILSAILAGLLLNEIPSSLVAVGALAALLGIYLTAKGQSKVIDKKLAKL